eukprot:TRINITY_DN33245_c0_g1_i1.p1 TRINITY_DN33245_c0_g1~~TRINITY_DN33245_c0_g1_i1.p1  ORF type:complete len:558 (+),score=73.34 TRINITY_DN33245_c0_g1_i1:71-1675(+)
MAAPRSQRRFLLASHASCAMSSRVASKALLAILVVTTLGDAARKAWVGPTASIVHQYRAGVGPTPRLDTRLSRQASSSEELPPRALLQELPYFTEKGVFKPAPLTPKLPPGQHDLFDGLARKPLSAELESMPPDSSAAIPEFLSRLPEVEGWDIVATVFFFIALSLGLNDFGPPHRRWFVMMGEALMWFAISLGASAEGVFAPSRRVPGGQLQQDVAVSSFPVLRRFTAFLEQAQRKDDRRRATVAADKLIAADERFEPLAVAIKEAVAAAEARALAIVMNTGTRENPAAAVSRGPMGELAMDAASKAGDLHALIAGLSLAERDQVCELWDNAGPGMADNGLWSDENRLPRGWQEVGTELRQAVGLTYEGVVDKQMRYAYAALSLTIIAAFSLFLSRCLTIGIGNSGDTSVYGFFSMSWALLIDFSVPQRQARSRAHLATDEEKELRCRRLDAFRRWANEGSLHRGSGSCSKDDVMGVVRQSVPELRGQDAVSDEDIENMLRIWFPELKRKTTSGGDVTYKNLTLTAKVSTIWR